jgi:hypothetical protein
MLEISCGCRSFIYLFCISPIGLSFPRTVLVGWLHGLWRFLSGSSISIDPWSSDPAIFSSQFILCHVKKSYSTLGMKSL